MYGVSPEIINPPAFAATADSKKLDARPEPAPEIFTTEEAVGPESGAKSAVDNFQLLPLIAEPEPEKGTPLILKFAESPKFTA